ICLPAGFLFKKVGARAGATAMHESKFTHAATQRRNGRPPAPKSFAAPLRRCVRNLFNPQSCSEQLIALFLQHASNNRAFTERGQTCQLRGADVDGPPVEALQERY